MALQAAIEVRDAFPEGVFWVPLAPIRDPVLVPSAMLQVLGVQEQPGREPVDLLCEWLGGKRLLILLDNAEHLLPDLARTVSQVHAVDGPTVMITSRERLRVAGEHAYPVPELDAADAVALFLARAAAAGVQLEHSTAVEELCAGLERLPLALELAAARTVVFTPKQLLDRLSQRLDLLQGGRDTDPRQQTLRTTIEWSYALLDPEEQRVFRALSVFAGGCTYEAAEQLAGVDPDTLQSLLDKSLLRRRETDYEPRYWMLETIREYAAERLSAEGEETNLRRRHAEWFAKHAAEVPDGERVVVLAGDDDNLRLALAYGTAHDPDLAVRLCRALTPYWFYRGRMADADHWGRALISATTGDRDGRRADALALAGRFRLFVDDPQSARDLIEQALAILRRGDDRLALVECLLDLGGVERLEHRYDEAITVLTEAVELCRGLDNPHETARVLHQLGEAFRDAGQFDAARERLQQVVALLHALGADAPAASPPTASATLSSTRGGPTGLERSTVTPSSPSEAPTWNGRSETVSED